ncbi:cytochrome c family protein [Phenylobacterium sp.]|jgi:cytochrome c2|uniref:c-type cytochrome n=1 Tax=Phenylobacterium sp. TaxID=1871053 RepID=UPI002F4234DD
MKPILIALALAGVVSQAVAQPVPPAAATPTGDPAKGQMLYAQCAACHEIDSDANTLGPSLKGVVGRKAGAVEGYNYSPPMRRAELTWTRETLDAFLTDPQAVVAGTKMPFAGMASPADRADLVAYLEAHGATPPPADAKPGP